MTTPTARPAPHGSLKGRVAAALARRAPLFAVLREDREVNEGWARPGFHAIAVARWGAWLESDAPPWARRPMGFAQRRAYSFVRAVYGIELPGTVTLGRRVRIAHHSGIVVHPNAVIGDDCVLRQGATLGAGRGDPRLFHKQAPKLGRGVSVGAGTVIVGNVRVGDGATLGPNATVMTHVPEGATVLAPPPRIIRQPITTESAADSPETAPGEAARP